MCVTVTHAQQTQQVFAACHTDPHRLWLPELSVLFTDLNINAAAAY